MHESKVAIKAQSLGWTVLRNGWPDLLLYDKKTNKALCVEIKSIKDKLPPHQKRMHKILKKLFDLETIIVYNNGGSCNNLPAP